MPLQVKIGGEGKEKERRERSKLKRKENHSSSSTSICTERREMGWEIVDEMFFSEIMIFGDKMPRRNSFIISINYGWS